MRDDEPFDDLPQSLVEELKAADRAMPMITARVDREVADMARAHFGGRRRSTQGWRPVSAAVAASLLIAVLVLEWPTPAPDTQGDLYADVDGSGRIDIADVLALAQKPGKHSRAELDAFAYRIVSLEHSGDPS